MKAMTVFITSPTKESVHGMFTKEIAELAGNMDCDIQPCHSNEFPSPVMRPAYSVLDKTKIKETFGVNIPYWKDSLKVCMININKQA